MSSSLPTHVQYRNSSYYGMFTDEKRNGYGLLVLDNASIIYARWSRNLLNGPYAYINDKLRAYGTFLDQKLDGYNVITSTQQPIRTLYGMFRNNKPYGTAVIIENNEVSQIRFVNGVMQEVLNKRLIRDKEVYHALLDIFPNQVHTLEEYLAYITNQSLRALSNADQFLRYQPMSKTFNRGYKFFGYLDNQDTTVTNKSKAYGFLMNENQIISVGEHTDDGQLQGIGRMHTRQGIQDGMFRQGRLRGIGVKYFKNGHKYALGEHDGQSALEKGFGFPTREIGQIRKQFHLRSIYFYNDIVMIGIYSQLYQILVDSINHYQKPSFIGNNGPTSPKFTSIKGQSSPKGAKQSGQFPPRLAANSPLRNKLLKYQRQSQKIQDPTPVKGKLFNEYQPTDYRAVKYFSLDEDQEAENVILQQPPIIRKQRQQQREKQRQMQIRRQRQRQRQILARQARKEEQIKKKSHSKSQQRDYQRSQYHAKTEYGRGSERQYPVNRRNKYEYQMSRASQNNQYNRHQQSRNTKYDNFLQKDSRQNKTSSNRERKESRFSKQTVVAKDTKALVRQLQEQERKKRLDLDRIYKEAGLYRKR